MKLRAALKRTDTLNRSELQCEAPTKRVQCKISQQCWATLLKMIKLEPLQHPTCRHTAQQGGQTSTKCCGQQSCNMLHCNVAIIWPGLEMKRCLSDLVISSQCKLLAQLHYSFSVMPLVVKTCKQFINQLLPVFTY